MKDQGIKFDQHWVWSDGAASQFKSCRPFYYVARYFRRFGARMKWFFHATGHGKGVADALGGHIKQGVEREQRKGTKGAKLECAHDVVSFCEEKFALGQAKEYGDVQFVRRFFWEIPVGAVNRNKKWDCDTIADDTPNECKNTLWTGRFKLHMVKGVLPADVRPDVDCMGVGEGVNAWEEGTLADLLQVGDFFAVEASKPNQWNADFYISQCEQPPYTVTKDFVDGYDQAWHKGDFVVKGRWFHPMPGHEGSYVFIDRAPFSYTLADQIVHIRFGLTPCEVTKGRSGGARVYSLDAETQAAIYDSFDH
ncbi:unnamed protein product [Calypogeia fissa]